MVGVAIAFSLSFVVKLLVDQFNIDASFTQPQHEALASFLNVVIGTICCYLSISFVLQTRDDFRFIIPYVEFSRQQKGPRAMVLDTSVLIDGRIADIAQTGILEGQVIVPQFIIDELQAVADSADKLKRRPRPTRSGCAGPAARRSGWRSSFSTCRTPSIRGRRSEARPPRQGLNARVSPPITTSIKWHNWRTLTSSTSTILPRR